MNQTTTIDQLQTLALPPAISYAPQTWGWLALLLLLLAGAAWYAARALYRWQRDRYQRLALAHLAQLQQRLRQSPSELAALRELPLLLKRCALSMPQRTHVANLSGAAWQTFMQTHSHGRLPAHFSQQLALLAYAPEAQLRQLSPAHIDTLLSNARDWLEHLHVAV
jgi:hypothetical protein